MRRYRVIPSRFSQKIFRHKSVTENFWQKKRDGKSFFRFFLLKSNSARTAESKNTTFGGGGVASKYVFLRVFKVSGALGGSKTHVFTCFLALGAVLQGTLPGNPKNLFDEGRQKGSQLFGFDPSRCCFPLLVARGTFGLIFGPIWSNLA